MIINKKYIVSINIVYQDDYDIYSVDEDNKDIDYYF